MRTFLTALSKSDNECIVDGFKQYNFFSKQCYGENILDTKYK